MNRFVLRTPLALLVLLTVAACASDAPAGARGAGQAVPVEIYAVASKPWQDAIDALGTAHANESVTITAKVTETVVRVNFTDGQEVAAGAVLVDLSGRAEIAALAEAQAAFDEASRLYQRQQTLAKAQTVSAAMLDQQRAARDTAKARADAIRARLGDRVITAPFAGRLGFRQVSPGALVTPGTVITTLDDVDPINLDFTLPERFLTALEPGQTITAHSEAFPGESFDGVVTAIDPRIDVATRALIVRAEVPNPERRLKPGLLMTLTVEANPRQSLVVPEIAVQAIGERSFVYRVDGEGRAQQVFVRLGGRRAGEVEVLDGLSAGDQIVTDGLVRVRPGVALKVQDPAARAG